MVAKLLARKSRAIPLFGSITTSELTNTKISMPITATTQTKYSSITNTFGHLAGDLPQQCTTTGRLNLGRPAHKHGAPQFTERPGQGEMPEHSVPVFRNWIPQNLSSP